MRYWTDFDRKILDGRIGHVNFDNQYQKLHIKNQKSHFSERR
jgi:hypothetical protein